MYTLSAGAHNSVPLSQQLARPAVTPSAAVAPRGDNSFQVQPLLAASEQLVVHDSLKCTAPCPVCCWHCTATGSRKTAKRPHNTIIAKRKQLN